MLDCLIASACLFACAAIAPDPPPLTRPIAALERDLVRLQQEYGNHLRIVEIGRTSSGRTLHAAIAADFANDDWNHHPGTLVIAGIDGRHAHGGELVLHHLASLLRDEESRAMLTQRTLYFVPRLNVDGIEARFQDPPQFVVGNLHPRDEDRDRRRDEDGPDDVDGDGVITWMRRMAVDGTYVPFGEAGLMRPVDRTKDEGARYTFQHEGHDQDGDERIDEDPIGDVSIDRNFPHAHPEHGGIGGLYPASEPETRAIIDFMLAHRNIVNVLVYGPHDDLRQAPKSTARRTEPETTSDDSPRSRFRRSRQAPTSVLPQDLSVLERRGKRYREATGLETAVRAESGGTFGEWAYYQFGAHVARACPWSPLDEAQFSPDEQKLSEDEREALALHRLAERLGHGFHPWKPFTHPDLGPVEIGGFEAGFGLEPDAATWNGLLASHDAFFRALVAEAPEVTFEEPEVTERAPGVYEIEVYLRNDGALPTASAMSQQARMRRSPLVRLQLLNADLVAGDISQFASHLDARGGRQGFRWIVSRKGEDARMAIYAEADTFATTVRIDLP